MIKMKSKLIYILTICFIFIACSTLYKFDLEVEISRIHQHKENKWEDNEESSEDIFQSHLPIVKIDTNGQKIPGTPISKEDGVIISETAQNGENTITAYFSITDGQSGNNQLNDQESVKSKSLIRYRGNSSRFFDKKSYSINLINEDRSENKQELAGMAKHDEWVLNGPFLDRSLLRNYLCLNISGEIMEYSPNVRYCELFVDGKYQGLYLLMESISRGEGRLNISKPEKNSDITSFIVRWDRAGKGEFELDNYTYYTYKSDVSALDVVYPGYTLITQGRHEYINEQISKVEKILYSYDLWDDKGYKQYLDVNAFAEYFVINEFFRNVDAGRFSTFYYKDARGKIKPVVWDFNNSADNYIDYVWDESGFSMQNAPWFSQLLKDKEFVDAVVEKYKQLRKNVLSEEYLINYIDKTNTWLGDSIKRNDEVWGYVYDLNNYNETNFLIPAERNVTSHEEAVEQLKEFIIKRGNWLDNHIESLYQYSAESKNANEILK